MLVSKPLSTDAPGGGPNGIVAIGAEDGSGEEEVRMKEKRKWKEEMALEKQNEKWARRRGAIVAPSRTAEGFRLTAGNQQSCMTDAIENAMKMHGCPEGRISTARMRALAIPKLGNVLQASWASCEDALQKLGLPYTLTEVTARFQGGPPMLNLLRATSGTFVVGLLVEVEGKKNAHCVAFSATAGKLVDNGSKTKPVYIEDKDKQGKKAARNVFRMLVEQKANGLHFSVDIVDIYELSELVAL